MERSISCLIERRTAREMLNREITMLNFAKYFIYFKLDICQIARESVSKASDFSLYRE